MIPSGHQAAPHCILSLPPRWGTAGDNLLNPHYSWEHKWITERKKIGPQNSRNKSDSPPPPREYLQEILQRGARSSSWLHWFLSGPCHNKGKQAISSFQNFLYAKIKVHDLSGGKRHISSEAGTTWNTFLHGSWMLCHCPCIWHQTKYSAFTELMKGSHTLCGVKNNNLMLNNTVFIMHVTAYSSYHGDDVHNFFPLYVLVPSRLNSRGNLCPRKRGHSKRASIN
jgi:hypothetical protein